MKVVHTNKGVVTNCSYLQDEQISTLKKALTYKQRIQSGKRISYKIAEFYRIYQLPDKKLFAIAPGAYNHNYGGCRDILGAHTTMNIVSQGDDINISGGVSLEPPQAVAHDYIIEHYLNPDRAAEGTAKCVFVMDAGLGKSFVACKLIETIKKKTLIVVMNTNQMQQWRTDVFGKYYPNTPVGAYCGTQKKDGDIVVVVINSLSKLPLSYVKQFGFIIYDEIPEFMGDKRRDAMWDCNVPYTIGLTATPDERLDGMDIFYKQMVGPIIRADDIDGFGVEKIIWKGNVTTVKYSGPPQFTKRLVSNTAELNCSMMNQQFSEDPYRTKYILNCIVELYNSGKYVYVFAQTRSHLERMHKSLTDMGIAVSEETDPDSDTIQTLMGGADETAIVAAKQKARIILTTYGYGAVGMSIVKMDAIIFMTPRKNKMRQILGRILRRGGDPSIVREIIDIVDVETDIRHQYSKRKKIYLEKGFTINSVPISYKDVKLN